MDRWQPTRLLHLWDSPGKNTLSGLPFPSPIHEDVTIINIYVPNIGTPKYVRQMLKSMKEEIKNNTIIVGELIPHSHLWIDQLNRKLTRKHKL